MEIEKAVKVLSNFINSLWGQATQKTAWSVIRAKIEEEKLNSAEKTQPCGETNKRMVKLLSDIQNSVQQRNNCLIIKESAMFEEINAVLAQQNHAS